MNSITQFQLLIFGLFLRKVDAAVNVVTSNSLLNTDSFVCSTSENLICTINPYGGTMTWQIGPDPAAYCTGSVCTSNSLLSADYDFDFNEAAGVFNLTIKKVTNSVNGTTYSCDDGFTSDSLWANVTVADDFETFTNDTTVDTSTNQTKLQITTGCLKENTASNVKFIWYYFKVNGSSSGKRYRDDSTEEEDDSACLADPDCGASGLIQISSELNITEEEEGDVVKFEVEIDFGTSDKKKIKVPFNVQFRLKFPETEAAYVLPCYVGILIAFLLIFLVEWQMCIYGYAFLFDFQKYVDKKCVIILYLCTHVPLLGFIPALGIHYYLHRKQVKLNIDCFAIFLMFMVCLPMADIFVMWTLACLIKRSGIRCFIIILGLVVLCLEILIAITCPVSGKHHWYYPFSCAVSALVPKSLFLINLVLHYKEKLIYFMRMNLPHGRVLPQQNCNSPRADNTLEDDKWKQSASQRKQGEKALPNRAENDGHPPVKPLRQKRNNFDAGEASEKKRKLSDLPETHRRNSKNDQTLEKPVLPPINSKFTT